MTIDDLRLTIYDLRFQGMTMYSGNQMIGGGFEISD